MTSDGKTLVFIPTYNERGNVEAMCRQLLELGLGADIVFLDDNSPDGTGEILDRLSNEFPCVSVIHRSGKLGIGSAHLAGIDHAYQLGYSRLITMDCDFTHSPGDIPHLLKYADTHDVVVGSRYMQANSLPGWNPLRKFLTGFGHLLTKHLLDMPFDATGAFRIYCLNRIPINVFRLIKSRGYSFFFESLFLLTRNGASIAEVPIVLPARTYGHSKMSYREAYHSGFYIFSMYLSDWTNPAQFRIDVPIKDINPALLESQGWDEYWTRKDTSQNLIYDIIAAVYRNHVIRPNLSASIKKHFSPGSSLLHTGCGSGQVDVDLHCQMKITALDVSVPALQLYFKNNPAVFALRHGSALKLPFANNTFNGVYNLGLLEHFEEVQIREMLREAYRVLKPGGKLLIFWPHRYASSVLVLKLTHWILNSLLHKNLRLHPQETSLLRSRKETEALLHSMQFQMIDYAFGLRDLFVQAIIVAEKQ
jgi:dolichol-phosphate mannosyltransferase